MLDQKTSKRIEADAAEKYPPGRFSTKWLRDRELDRQQAYVNGASAEAERAQGLVEQMGYAIKRIDEYHSHTGETGVGVEVKTILNHALTKYNNSKD